MREGRICLAHADSLKMLRFARADPMLMLAPASDRVLREIEGSVVAETILSVLPNDVFEPAAQPVQLRFDDASSRSRCSLVRSCSALDRLPTAGYLEVLSTEGDPFCVNGSSVEHVVVEAPGLALASAANELCELVSRGRLPRESALIRLVGLAMELCGIYARDPCAPLVGPVAYELETISSVHESMELLDELKGRRGVSLARRAIKYANDGSGSVMETFWYGVFCLPPRLGGSNLPRPLQNAPLEWSLDVADVVSHERMRPDFYWSQYNTACEHQGGDHAREAALAEDSRRARDYELCGIHYLPLTKRDAQNEGAVRDILSQLFRIISLYEGPAFKRKAARILNDSDVRAARRVLLGQLLPPLARWGE